MNGMRVMLVGFLLPDRLFESLLESDEGMPIQTQRFGLSLMRSLQAGGAEVAVISASPATTFPHNSAIFFRGGRFEVEGSRGVLLGFVNLPILKHLTRVISVMWHGPKYVRGHRSDVLMIHGIHSPWLVFGVFASRRLRVPAVAVVTDPPNVPHQFDTAVTRVLKRADQHVVKYLLSKLDGVVALTRHLAEDYAPGLKSLVMEGISPEPAPLRPHSCDPPDRIPVVLYAGGLSEEYGVTLLMDAHALNPEAFRLHIAGRGPLESVVRLRAARECNLDFLGLVPPGELAQLYDSADVLVNPRPPGQGFTRYSFPSKLLEYVASGALIVSTRLEGVPEEYGDVVFWAEPTSRGLLTGLELALGSDPRSRSERGLAAQSLARSRSMTAQGTRIVRFLADIVDVMPDGDGSSEQLRRSAPGESRRVMLGEP